MTAENNFLENNFMEPYSKKNFQVKHGKYGSIMPPPSLYLPLEAIIIRSHPWRQEDSSPTSWNLSTEFIYTVPSYKGFWKAAKECVGFKFHKRINIFSLKKKN